MDGTPDIDLAEADHFLSMIAEDEEITFQLFDDVKSRLTKNIKERKYDPYAKILHGALQDHAQDLIKWNKEKAGIFFTVNRTDLKGRETKNVTAIRALFIDLDGAPLPKAWELQPHVVVESSPSRFHAYWLVKDCSVDQFKPVQKALAAKYGSDPSVYDLPRVMRIPGFLHQKNGAFQSKVLEASWSLPYSLEEIVSVLHLELKDEPAATGPDLGNKEQNLALKRLYELELLIGEVPGHPGKWRILCPWRDKHTNGDLVAAYYEPHTNGFAGHGFKCLHAHCAERTVDDFIQAISPTVNTATAPSTPADDPPWPDPPIEEAYYGIAGEVVRTFLPHTEADPAAILIQFLIAFGNMIGRKPHFRVEGDRHYTNLYAVLVGITSRARKGTSWGRVQQLLTPVALDWANTRIETGLSSGEGLIWSVRDPIVKREKKPGAKDKIEYIEVEADPGVTDKRLMILEPEYANVLRQIEREGNILSRVIRDAWDKGTLASLSKNSPARATGALISIVGHITQDELRRYLTRTESVNGFANRFLFICVKRSQCLPFGGALADAALTPFATRINEILKIARTIHEVPMDRDAAADWIAIYPALSHEESGLVGAIIARAEAQVRRLALLYALLDGAAEVRREHLNAALAIWRYAEASARYLFGDTLGNPTADEILNALKAAGDAGMTRTEINRLFNSHKEAAAIGGILARLLRVNRVGRSMENTGGRSSERWKVVKK